MNDEQRTIRRPKEDRNPKAEAETNWSHVLDSDFWRWEDEQGTANMALHDSASEQKPSPAPLDERTALFGEAVIRFAKKIPQNVVNERLISQLVGAATSIGANYCEADDSVSGKEFKLRIGTCRKESKETMFFLRMIAAANPLLSEEARTLWREAKELNLIFGAIWRK